MKEREKTENTAEENPERQRALKEITDLMIELGIPAHLRGYYYLREAVFMTAEEMELVGSITKLLYPEVAKKFKCTGEKVERAIRNSVEVSWERGNVSLLEQLFGYSREDKKKRPTNSEFIVVLADYVKRMEKSRL